MRAHAVKWVLDSSYVRSPFPLQRIISSSSVYHTAHLAVEARTLQARRRRRDVSGGDKVMDERTHDVHVIMAIEVASPRYELISELEVSQKSEL